MEKKIIYGVFAINVELPEKSNIKEEVRRIAESMKALSEVEQCNKSRFVRAYSKLEDAVEECYNANGALLSSIIESPEGVLNSKTTSYFFPRKIVVDENTL